MPPSRAPATPSQVTTGVSFVIVFVILAIVAACGGDSPTPAPEKPVLRMPYLRGLESLDAWGSLDDVGIDWIEDRGPEDSWLDLSYLHRDPEAYDWKVWSTFPKAGAEVTPGETITVFLLEDQEYDFFREHRRMPKTGWKFQQSMGGAWRHPMEGIVSLTEERYVPELAPAGARREPDQAEPPTSGLPRRLDPSIEPKLERYLRNTMKESDGYDQFMGTIPHAGQKLRPGQSIILLFRPDPEFYPEVYGLPDPADNYDWDVYVDTHDDDDDGNIPGWLCPTRFC